MPRVDWRFESFWRYLRREPGWSRSRSWKPCGLNGFGGSNPSPSATSCGYSYKPSFTERWQSGRLRQVATLMSVTAPGVRIPLSLQKLPCSVMAAHLTLNQVVVVRTHPGHLYGGFSVRVALSDCESEGQGSNPEVTQFSTLFLFFTVYTLYLH